MQDSDIPVKFDIPFGQSAFYITNPIPTAPASGGHASLTEGFPPTNSTAVDAGGIPPWGADQTGINFMETKAIRWTQAGGQWPYDSGWQTTIGGYPKGAIVASATSFGRAWLSLADNNLTDPETFDPSWTNWPINFFGNDSGSLNAVAATFSVPLTSVPIGKVLYVKVANTSTSTTPTFSYNGAGGVTLTNTDGTALFVGDLVQGVVAQIMVASGGHFWLLNPQTQYAGSGPGPAPGPNRLASGQCRLIFSDAATITLVPYNGQGIIVNGALRTIPGGGIALSNSGFAASTTYYIYADWSGSSPILRRSTTGYAVASNGTYVKSGDGTQALVGMVSTDGSGNFVAGLVLSWFNRRQLSQQGDPAFTSGTIATTTLTDPGAGSHLSFLLWADEGVTIGYGGYSNSSPDQEGGSKARIQVDGVQVGSQANNIAGPTNLNAVYAALPGALAEGLHVAVPLVALWDATSFTGVFFPLLTVTTRG